MHSLIVLSHPEPASFNGAMASLASEVLSGLGHTVELSDLHTEAFDPVECARHYRHRQDASAFSALAEQRHAWNAGALPGDVRREVDRLERADLVILQFPLWWHAQPAMLKGWFDRVFVSGGLYTSRMRYDSGYFRGKRALLSVTTGAPAEAMGPGSRGGDIERLLWPIEYSLYYVGFTVLPAFVVHGVQGHGFSYRGEAAFEAYIETCKADWVRRLESLDQDQPRRFPGWDDWDSSGRAKSGRRD